MPELKPQEKENDLLDHNEVKEYFAILHAVLLLGDVNTRSKELDKIITSLNAYGIDNYGFKWRRTAETLLDKNNT